MLRVALLADRIDHEVLDLLRGLRRHEFHLVTLDDDGPALPVAAGLWPARSALSGSGMRSEAASRPGPGSGSGMGGRSDPSGRSGAGGWAGGGGLPGNVLSMTNLPRRLPASDDGRPTREPTGRWPMIAGATTCDGTTLTEAWLRHGAALHGVLDGSAPSWAAVRKPSTWLIREAAARHLSRGYLRGDRRTLAVGLRMLAGLSCPGGRAAHPGTVAAGWRMLAGVHDPGTGPGGVPFQPVVGPHPLGRVRLDALGGESLPAGHAAVLHDALRPLALRLPPVHVVHAIGPRAGLAALAHSWRRGTPYVLSGVDPGGPVTGLCHDRAYRAVARRLVLDARDYPPRRAEPAVPAVLEVAGGSPLGAAHYAGATVVVATAGPTFPLVEAMMSGLPVVAVEADGVADLLGGAGLVVPATAVRATCDRLLADPELRWRLGLLARRRALDRHALGLWLAAHEEHYRVAAGGG
ncbi:hypothetical protein Lfu02_50320 [Longispora fulva]|uniref:Glycosyltransferase n=1 Tax=Longispora fulva TaxID=619741 RepID=A0A8J7GNI0_9ACTN|nr:glycosyltransferase [Longispora fulva]MBG6141070.1 hypothetical protein [Longispora fulva]GIG60660.1 hypothetical protein Lfu02_50320 [Longispora fulva]